MSEELRKLKTKRGNFKGQLTRFRTVLDTLDTGNIDQLKITQLNVRLDKIQPLYDEFVQCQNDIEFLTSHTDMQNEGTELINFENEYFELISRASIIISTYEMEHKVELADDAQSDISSRSRHFQSPHGNTFAIKLPEIKLPKFSGTYDKWLEFRDAFNSMIDKNDSLDAVQKFYYLRAHLEGEAARMIESITVTEQNYKVALTLLEQRYENKRLIIFNYVKALFEAAPMTRESFNDLRNLFDTFSKNVRSLQALGQKTDEWSVLLIYLFASKFDNRTRRDWEAYKIQGDLPAWQDITSFLKDKCDLLEKLEAAKGESNRQHKPFKGKQMLLGSYMSSDKKNFKCFYCKKPHSIFKCSAFTKLDINKRNMEVKRLRLCLNCLNPNHSAQECPKHPCIKCSRYINSILHNDGNSNTDGNQHSRPELNQQAESTGNVRPDERERALRHPDEEADVDRGLSSLQSVLLGQANKYALLSTAEVLIFNKNDQAFKARILLDAGSQSNFITDSFCKKVGLQKQKVNISITGVGNSNSVLANYKTNVKIKSCVGNFCKEVTCLVLDKITHPMPICSFNTNLINIPQGVVLADPEFNIRKDIDILCGVGLFYEILLMNQMKLDKSLILQSTRLGWVLAGEINYSASVNNNVFSCLSVDDEINKNLVRFWENEECDSVAKLDDICEEYFKNNFKRDLNGRFIVNIPFNENKHQLGNSKQNALRCFNFLERRLSKNIELKQEYENFMLEYEKLGHMTLLTENIDELSDGSNGDAYYLSHHAVIKTSSLTTRLRVVFNGSARTDSGLSLNDVQHIGPTIQNDLLTILLNFRKHTYILNADISKMYRQVVIEKSDRRFQRIFWRKNPSESLKCYELNVITYGLASSPFLATRCLLQLAVDNEEKYPSASNAIKNYFYIDDLLTGSDSRDELLQLQKDISIILSSAGFELRKYLSNDPDLFEKLEINSSLEASILQLGENENNKTLGVYWNAHYDTIEYQVQNYSDLSSVTKRSILSIIGQIFDILGLLGPVIIRGKIMLQMLWKGKFSWDEEIGGTLREKWISFCKDLIYLNQIKIPRYVFCKNPLFIELHTFADSSETSYGACAYIRCKINYFEFSCRLVTAKSKVAPVRVVTLPRLELSAAVLACKIVEKVKKSLDLNSIKCYYWSDSTITLCWIKGSPDRWKKFVSNRVSYIQNKSNTEDWFHVKSSDNPADLISRGVSAQSIINNSFWFEGPQWLKLDKEYWPSTNVYLPQEAPEQRLQVNLIVAKNDWDIFSRFSSLTKLKRVIALCRRFLYNLRQQKSERVIGELDSKEINDALINLVKIAQVQSFRAELNDLQNKNSVSNSSKLLSLQPFLHDDIIRVGGRIKEANIPFSKKHPIVLHNKHKLTELILKEEHWRLMHCGPQHLLYSVRDNFWPISGRNLARQVVHKCVVCFKVKPKPYTYLMGNLPAERLDQCAPFLNTGCDYTGVFMMKDRQTRGYKLIKAYVCVFVCMTTKAIHLELVTSLTGEAFLSTLRRFIARRGKPLNIFSDNGTNFTSANSELQNFLKSNSDLIKHNLANDGVKWHFIPSRAPHFGGLWEAGVKSFKHHLKRVVGDTHLDYEQFTTVLQQIESILNSRPLSPLSSSPLDVSPLTPGHFLIGRPLVSLPDPDLTEIKENRLSKYQRIQQMTQHFWKRWYKEYISELQSRQKWNRHEFNNIKSGDLVVIKDDHLPPLKWKLARVAETFPGADTIVRVVSVRFSDGSIAKRAINKVCPLPIN